MSNNNRMIKDLTVLAKSYEKQLKIEYLILDKLTDPIKLQDKIDEIRELEAALEATKEQIDSIEVE